VGAETATTLLAIGQLAIQQDFSVDSYDWGLVMNKVAAVQPLETINVLAEAIASRNSGMLEVQDKSVEILIGLSSSHHSKSVMNALGKYLLHPEHGLIFKIKVYRGLFEAIDIHDVTEFIRQNGSEAAKAIARHLASPKLNEGGEPDIPPLTMWLLKNFENEDKVFSAFLAGRHAFEARYGNPKDREASVRKLVEPFVNNPLRRVREWAEYEVKSIEWEIETDKRFQEDVERL
jgi:hypothetical protein